MIEKTAAVPLHKSSKMNLHEVYSDWNELKVSRKIDVSHNFKSYAVNAVKLIRRNPPELMKTSGNYVLW